MCGRYGTGLSAEEVSELFDDADVPAEYVPRYNVAPGQDALIASAPDGSFRLSFGRWGFQDTRGSERSVRPINARSESVAARPLFRDAFRECRCLVPATGFYEWRKGPGGKTPYWISTGAAMAFAGIVGHDAQERPNFAILTRPAPPELGHIHDRVPVLLERPAFGVWLDRNAERSQLVALMRAPLPPLRAHPVSTRVNHVDQDDPDLLRVVAEPLELPLE